MPEGKPGVRRGSGYEPVGAVINRPANLLKGTSRSMAVRRRISSGPPKGLKGFKTVGPTPTESVLATHGHANKEFFANFEEIVPLDFGKPSGKSRL